MYEYCLFSYHHSFLQVILLAQESTTEAMMHEHMVWLQKLLHICYSQKRKIYKPWLLMLWLSSI